MSVALRRRRNRQLRVYRKIIRECREKKRTPIVLYDDGSTVKQ